MLLNEREVELIKLGLNNRSLMLLSWISCEHKVNIYFLRKNLNEMYKERKEILELMHKLKSNMVEIVID